MTAGNFSPTVVGMMNINQLLKKVDDTEGIVYQVLPDMSRSRDFLRASGALRQQIAAHGHSLFTDWQELLLDDLRSGDGDLSLSSAGHLMQFDVKNEGKLIVHFSERLVGLVREVRQLNEIGYSVDQKIQSAVATAEKYFRYALQLQQVNHYSLYIYIYTSSLSDTHNRTPETVIRNMDIL